MVEIKDLNNKVYHFRLEPREESDAPEVDITNDNFMKFSPEEMLYMRNFYKENGRDALFEDMEGDELLYDYFMEDVEVLTDSLYSVLGDGDFQLSDYYIVPSDELLNDLLDDNYTDWDGIQKAIDDEGKEIADEYDKEMKEFEKGQDLD